VEAEDEDDLFTDSSSDEDDQNSSSIFTPTSSSISSSSSTLALLTRIQSLEAQVRLHEEKKITVNDDARDALAAQARDHGIEKQAMLTKMTKLTDALLEYEDMLENATATEDQISSILDAKAFNLVEHEAEDDAEDAEDGEALRVRQQAAAVEIAAAVAQEHQRMLEQHSFLIESMEEAHQFQLLTLKNTEGKKFDNERQKRDKETMEVLERLKKSEQEAIESNAALQKVVEEVEREVGEERQRHVMVMGKRNTDAMTQREEDKKKLENVHRLKLEEERTKHESITVTMEAEHKLAQQHLQQQHEMDVGRKSAEWREQIDQELDALTSGHQLKIDDIKAFNAKRMDEEIDKWNKKHIHDMENMRKENEEEKEQRKKEHNAENERERQEHRARVQKLEEEHEETKKLWIEVKDQLKKSERFITEAKSEHELALCSQVLSHREAMETMQVAMQQQHKEEINSMRSKHQKHVEEVEKELHQLEQARTTCQAEMESYKDSKVEEIASIKREASKLFYHEMGVQREKHESEMLDTEEYLRSSHEETLGREKSAHAIQRWCRETLYQRATAKTLRLLIGHASEARNQLLSTAIESEQALSDALGEISDMKLAMSIKEEEHAVATQNTYEDCATEVNRRVLETTKTLSEKHKVELEEAMAEAQSAQEEKIENSRKEWEKEVEMSKEKSCSEHMASVEKLKGEMEDQEKLHRAQIETTKEEHHLEITRMMGSNKAQRKEWLLASEKEAEAIAAAATACAQAQWQQEKEQEVLRATNALQETMVRERQQWRQAHRRELEQVKAAYEATTQMKAEEHKWNLQRITESNGEAVRKLEEEVSRTVNNGRITEEGALLQQRHVPKRNGSKKKSKKF
jgi:hypothetical protein